MNDTSRNLLVIRAPVSTTKWFVDYSLTAKTKVYFGIVCKHR